MNRQNEGAEQRRELNWPRRVALACVFGSAAVGGAAVASEVIALDTSFGPGEISVQPTLDGYGTGAIEGVVSFRVPLDTPLNLGAKAKLKSAGSAGDAQNILGEYAAIASNSKAEIDNIAHTAEKTLALDLLIGLAAGALATDYTRRVLRDRRKQEKTVGATRATVGGLVLATATVGCAYQSPAIENYTHGTTWLNIGDFVPGITMPDEFRKAEVSNTIAAQSVKTQIKNFINQYEESETFYSTTAKAVAEELPAELPVLAEGEYWGVFVTDRHDNVGMDKVVEAVVDVAKPEDAYDAGDDVAGAGKVFNEDFSIRSLGKALQDVPNKYAAEGNHDGLSKHIRQQLEKQGFEVLNNDVKEAHGLKVAGIADPRETIMTTEMSGTGESLESVGERLAKKTCDEGGVGVAIVHSPEVGDIVAGQGCADLVISGHTHEEAAPVAVSNSKTRISVTYTSGSTGGSTLIPVTLGKLRKYAEVSLIRFNKDDSPIGIQTVRVNTNGSREYHYYDFSELDAPTVGKIAPIAGVR